MAGYPPDHLDVAVSLGRVKEGGCVMTPCSLVQLLRYDRLRISASLIISAARLRLGASIA